MYKYTISVAPKVIIFLLFFQSGAFTSLSQETSSWARPFQLCWNHKSNQIIGDQIASDNNGEFPTVVFSTRSGHLTALNSETGEMLWSIQIGGEILSRPVFYKNELYLVTRIKPALVTSRTDRQSPEGDSVVLRALDPSTGLTRREKALRSVRQLLLFGNGNKIVFIDEKDGLHISEIENETDPIKFEIKASDMISAVYLSDNVLVTGTHNKEILLLSVTDGRLLKKIKTENVPIRLFFDDDKLVWTDTRGFINLKSLDSQKVFWRKRGGAVFTGINRVSGGYLVTSLDNFVYLLDEDSGDVVWKKRFENNPLSNPITSGDTALVVVFDTTAATFVSLENGRIINSLLLSDANTFLDYPLVTKSGLVVPTMEGLFSFTTSVCERKKSDE